MRVYKIGNVELTLEDIEKALPQKPYIIAYRRIYEILHDSHGFYGRQIYYHDLKEHYVPLVGKGRYMFSDAEHINNILEFDLIQ